MKNKVTLEKKALSSVKKNNEKPSLTILRENVVSLQKLAARGTSQAAQRARTVSNIHVYVKDGNLIQEQNGTIAVLKEIETGPSITIGTKFNLNIKRNVGK